VFPATNKREIADKQKMDDSNNISGRSHEIHLALSSKNGAGQVKIRTLSIDNRRKITLPYRLWRNTNKQAYDRIYVAGGAELMW